MIRVLIADDQELLRSGLRVLLDNEDDITVVGEAGDGQTAVDLAQATRPDVVVMDISMPGVDGVQATRRITADPALDGVRVLILTSFETDEYLFEALRGGASGFLTKDAGPAQILDAVRVVTAGQSLLTPSATQRLIQELTRWPERRTGIPPLLEELTQREREVLTLVAYGLTNQQIAQRLIVTLATAKTHVSRTMTKLHAHDRAQLVVLAHQSGLVSSGATHGRRFEMAVSATATVPTVPPATPIADARRRPSSLHVERPRVLERSRGTAHPSVPTTRPPWPSAPRHDVS